jgi:glucose-1-phosphate adenylyltransferase
MGIYIFNKQVMCERLAEDAAQADSPHDFGYAILPSMVSQDRVFAYQFKNYWRDIGTAAAYYEANMEIISQQASFSLDGMWPVLTAEHDYLPPKDLNTGNIVNSIISPGCIIKGRVENSILSPGVCIEDEAIVRNSVLMSNVFVGYHSVVEQCVLDERVNIGKFCYIGFGANLPADGRETTVLGKRVIVPSYTAIGHNCKVLPYVDTEDFISSSVPSGLVIRRSKSENTPNREEVGIK